MANPREEKPSCPACGSMVDGQHNEGCPTQQTTITDKRGKNKKSDAAVTEHEETPEEKQRREAWEGMSEQERQEVLAQQAKDAVQTPYEGGGIQAEPNEDAGKKDVIAVFAVIIHLDGTAVATDEMDVSKYTPQYPVSGAMIHRACCEIKKDVESTDAATHTLRMINTNAAAMQARMQGQQLQGRIAERGKGKQG